MTAGGTYLTYNKTLPGAYINFVSKARSTKTLGERGTVALALPMKWGQRDSIITIDSSEIQKNCTKILGYSYTSDEMLNIREIFRNAKAIKLFRLGGGQKATATIGNLTITAKHEGSRGNDIKIKISPSLEQEGAFSIQTYLDEKIVSEQTVSESSELCGNEFVDFRLNSGITAETLELTTTASTSLTDGTDTESTKEEFSKFLELLEFESFDTLLYQGDDSATKALFEAFTKRLRNDEGIKITTILLDYAKADFEGITSLKNAPELIYWLAGASSGANINQSLTNKAYDGEKSLDTKTTSSQLKEAIKNGDLLFYSDYKGTKILKDINTFTSFTPEKNSDFSNNQVVRILDSIANDIAHTFSTYYLGKVQNDSLGRDLFKSEVIDYINSLQAINAIEGFTSEDISIEKGSEKGDVIVSISVMPIAAMEKLYMKCVIE